MKRLILAVVLCLVPAFAGAQTPEDIVSQERAKFGPMLAPGDAPKLLTAIARRLPGGPWGLLVKPDGNQCGGFACDVVCDATNHYDVLISSPANGQPGSADPAWQPIGPYAPRVCNFIVGGPGPAPPSEVAELREQVADALDRLARVEQLAHRLQAGYVALDGRTTALEARPLPEPSAPFPCSVGKLWGLFPVRSCPEVPR